jgi:hypothetical protein
VRGERGRGRSGVEEDQVLGSIVMGEREEERGKGGRGGKGVEWGGVELTSEVISTRGLSVESARLKGNDGH